MRAGCEQQQPDVTRAGLEGGTQPGLRRLGSFVLEIHDHQTGNSIRVIWILVQDAVEQGSSGGSIVPGKFYEPLLDSTAGQFGPAAARTLSDSSAVLRLPLTRLRCASSNRASALFGA